MKRLDSLKFALPGSAVLSFLLLCILILNYGCKNKGVTDPVGQIQESLYLFSDFSVDKDEIGAGGQTASVSAVIINGKSEPVKGISVAFSAVTGTITQSDSTDDEGLVSATYTSGSTVGVDTIKAEVTSLDGSVKTQSAIITVVPTYYLDLSISNQSLLADGISNTHITGVVTDGSQSPVASSEVIFYADYGTIDPSGVTDEAGKAYIQYTSPAMNVNATDQITALISTVSTAKGAAGKFVQDTSTDTLNISLTGVVLDLSAVPGTILANGISKSVLTATLKTSGDSLLPSKPVNFSTNFGTILLPQAVTDQNGQAGSEVLSASIKGQATVTAVYGDSITASAIVNYTDAAGSVQLVSNKQELTANGTDAASLTATLVSGDGSPISDETIDLYVQRKRMLAWEADVNNGSSGITRYKKSFDIDDITLVDAVWLEFDIKDIESDDSDIKVNGTLVTSVSLPQSHGREHVTVELYSDNVTDLLVSGSNEIDIKGGVIDGNFDRFNIANVQIYAEEYIQLASGQTGAEGTAGFIYTSETVTGQSRLFAQRGIDASIRDTVMIKLRAGDPANLFLGANKSEIYASGEESIIIDAVVTDNYGNAVDNEEILFAANAGTISSSVFTSDGLAQADLVSEPSSSDIDVTVNVLAGNIQQSLAFQFTGLKVAVSSDKDALEANGTDNAVIQALLTDSKNNPVGQKTIYFSTSLGTIPSSSITNTEGKASVNLVSSVYNGTATVTARYGQFIRDSLQVNFVNSQSFITMLLSANPTNIQANGNSVSQITAVLRNENNNPITGETVNFSSSLGSIPSSGVTNDDGIATVDLRSDRSNGVAKVICTYNTVAETTYVVFSGIDLTVTSSPSNLVADGQSKSVIKVTLKDAADVAISGKPVSVTSTLGDVFSGSGETDYNGEYIDSLSSTVAGTAQIRAEAAGTFSTASVTFTGYNFTLSADPALITAGIDTCTVTAVLLDNQNNPVTGVPVYFSSSIGNIIGGSTQTDAQAGTASTKFYSGQTGVASITARATVNDEEILQTVSVSVVAAPPENITISATPRIVQIDGGRSTVTAIVTDVNQNPVENVTVSFNILKGLGGGEVLDPSVATTNKNGIATATFISGTIGSKLQDDVEITSQVQGTSISSNTVYLTVAGSPNAMEVGSNLNNFTDNQDGTLSLPIAATVSDINGNAVVDGTFVFFRISPVVGVIVSPIETESGKASTTLTYPASAAGMSVSVLAESGGISDSLSITLPGPSGDPTNIVLLSPSNSKMLGNGLATSQISALVTDINDNPVNDVRVNFQIDIGSIESSVLTGNELDDTGNILNPGQAQVTVTSPATTEDRYPVITAYIGDSPQSSLSTTLVSSDTSGIRFTGVSFELSASSSSVRAGQTDTIYAVIKETTSKVAIQGGGVSFGTSLGSIQLAALTSSSGIAENYLQTKEGETGLAYVIGQYGNTLIDTVTVNIYEQTPASAEFTEESKSRSILANGNEETDLTVLVKDDQGNPVPGESVTFQAVQGSFQTAEVFTNQSGFATATLRSVASVNDVYDTVSVAITGIEEQKTAVLYRGITFALSADSTKLPADGSSNTGISVLVKETENGQLISGDEVIFSTNLGTVSPAQNDLVSGTAASTLTAGINTGIARIVARYGNTLYDTTYVDLYSNYQDSLNVALSSSSLLANGTSTTTITATVFDSVGTPVKNVPVSFSAVLGSISDAVQSTDESGKAYVTLTSLASYTDRIDTLTIIADGLSAQSKQIQYRGITLESSTDKTHIAANNATQATITTVVKETTNGNLVSGESVQFSTNLGSVTPSQETLSNGSASTVLRAGTVTGTANVVTSYGNTLYDTVSVELYEAVPDSIYITASSSAILADGVSKDTVTVIVYDSTDAPLANARVDFSQIEGSYNVPYNTTNDSGKASVIITSFASKTDYSEHLVAYAGTAPQPELYITYKGITLDISTSPASLPANGIDSTKVTASLRETTSGLALNTGTVTFGVSDGVLSVGDADVISGEASVYLRAPSSPATVSVRASYGDSLLVIGSTEFYQSTPYTIQLQAKPDSIIATKNNGTKTNTFIYAYVTDAQGDTVVDGTNVTFTTTLGVFGNSASTDTAGTDRGVSKVAFHSENTAGKASITATSGTASSTRSLIVITSNAVDTIEVGIASLGEQDPAYPSDYRAYVSAFVKDVNGNPVLDNTEVSFSITSPGLIESSGFTVNGVARVYVRYHSQDVNKTVTIGTTVGVYSNSTQITLPATGKPRLR